MPDAAVVDWRGGFVLPGFVDAHVHFPQLRIIGALGRSLLDWLEHVALPEEARMADVAYAADTARRFVARACVARHDDGAGVRRAFRARARRRCSTLRRHAGCGSSAAWSLSDRFLRRSCTQTADDAYRDSTDLIRRFHRRGRLLYAVTPRFALSTTEAMLEVCQTLLQRARRPARADAHQREPRTRSAEVRRLFPWARDYLDVYERYGLIGARTVMAHNVHTTDVGARTAGRDGHVGRPLSGKQRGARQRHLSVAAVTSMPASASRSGPTWAAASGSA